LQVAPCLLHLDENARLPNQVGESSPSVVAACDALLQGGTGFAHAVMPECPKEAVEKDLGFALLVTGQMLFAVPNERVESLAKRVRCGVGRHGVAVQSLGSPGAKQSECDWP